MCRRLHEASRLPPLRDSGCVGRGDESVHLSNGAWSPQSLRPPTGRPSVRASAVPPSVRRAHSPCSHRPVKTFPAPVSASEARGPCVRPLARGSAAGSWTDEGSSTPSSVSGKRRRARVRSSHKPSRVSLRRPRAGGHAAGLETDPPARGPASPLPPHPPVPAQGPVGPRPPPRSRVAGAAGHPRGSKRCEGTD